MLAKFTRVLRTPSSERYLLHGPENRDVAALDLHFLTDGTVAGTLIVFDDSLADDERVEELLEHIDESLLPMASLDDANLTFTVVRGAVVGTFQAQSKPPR